MGSEIPRGCIALSEFLHMLFATTKMASRSLWRIQGPTTLQHQFWRLPRGSLGRAPHFLLPCNYSVFRLLKSNNSNNSRKSMAVWPCWHVASRWWYIHISTLWAGQLMKHLDDDHWPARRNTARIGEGKAIWFLWLWAYSPYRLLASAIRIFFNQPGNVISLKGKQQGLVTKIFTSQMREFFRMAGRSF